MSSAPGSSASPPTPSPITIWRSCTASPSSPRKRSDCSSKPSASTPTSLSPTPRWRKCTSCATTTHPSGATPAWPKPTESRAPWKCLPETESHQHKVFFAPPILHKFEGRTWSLAVPRRLRRMGGACFSLPSERSSDVFSPPQQPHHQARQRAHDQARRQRKVEARILPLNPYVSRQPSERNRRPPQQRHHHTRRHQHQPHNNQRSPKRHNHSMRFLAAVLAIVPLCAQSPDQKLAREIFQQLIEINTTDSSGDNTHAAEAMAARFRAAGFPESDIHVLAPIDRKGNLVVRLHGTGAARPILFLGHLDVVEALRSDWPFDPFVFRQQDGYFYGRGTSDMKGDDATLVAAFLRMKRENFHPARDLISSEEHTSELQSPCNLVCRLLLEKK